MDNLYDNKNSSEIKEKEEKNYIKGDNHDKVEEKVENKKKVKKIKRKRVHKPIHHIWFFIISILFGFFVRFWL
jgi:hypothetical protein